ncbi:hypothetical protein ACI797_18690 [Geodermatophilus sp. SYSU D00691]
MRQTYRVLAGLIALGVVLQAASVAFGWFEVISEVDEGAVFDENTEFNLGQVLHGVVGLIVIPALSLILLIVSFFAVKQVPHGRTWAGIVFGAVVVQVVLAFVSFGLPAIGALHGINAFVIAGAAGRAMALARTPAAERTDVAAGTSLPV